MRFTTRTWRAGVAALSAGVGLAGLAILAPTAHADAPASTFTWAFSTYMQNPSGQLKPMNATDGATLANSTVTFTDGSGAVNTGTGISDVRYQGDVTFGMSMAGITYYTVTFSDPEVTVDASGNGAILADVSWDIPGSTPVTGTIPDATLTTFATDSRGWDTNTLTATPAWAGVAADGEYGAAGKPVGGKSWNPTFVKALPSTLQAFFYASGSSKDADKAPAEFTASIAATTAPQVSATTTSASYANGLNLSVQGTGFRGVTNVGDAGVYVALAPSGGLPDVSSQAGRAAFAAMAWVSAASIVNNGFTTALNAPTNKLSASTAYSLYTWQAHSHSTTTQDTETPVVINWSALAKPAPAPVTLTAQAAKAFGYGKGTIITITAKGIKTGTLTLAGIATKKVALTNGNATVKIPATWVVGRHTVNINYAGDATHKAAKTSIVFNVVKSFATLRTPWVVVPNSQRPGAIRLIVSATKGALIPRGNGKVVLIKGKTRLVVGPRALTKGVAQFPIRKLGKGTWTVVVSYLGSANHIGTAKRFTLRVTR